MTFAGWTLSQLAVVFGIGAGAITLLYLLRMRRREVVVPFAALWEQVTRESESRQIWRKLRRLLSWLVQLLVLALLCLALGDPRPEVWLRDPVSLAIVIDRSASMAGPSGDQVPADGESTEEEALRRIELARQRAIAEIRGLGPVDKAVVIAAGEEVSVAAALSADVDALVGGIETIEPSYGEADLTRALALADHAVGGAAGPRILVITDGALDAPTAGALQGCIEGPIPCSVVAVEGPPANVAITAFAARRYPEARDKIEVLAEVRNLGDDPAVVDLDVEAEGVSVGKRRLELQGGQSTREVIGDLDAARSQFIARLEAPEDPPAGFSSDLGPAFGDVAYAVVPPLAPLEVALVSDGTNLFLDAALLTLGEHVRLTVADGSEPDLAESDLVIYDMGPEPLPATLASTNLLIFDPWRHEGSTAPIVKRGDLVRPFLTEQERKHPLLDFVVLKDINIARGTSLQVEPGDTSLVRSLGESIIVVREKEHLVVEVGFDPRQSDFPLRIAFPLFIDNVVRYVEQRTPGFVAAVQLGESRELALADLGLEPQSVTRVRVEGPETVSAELPVEKGNFRLRALVPGIYSVTAVDGPTAGAAVEVAVNQASIEASDLHSRLPALELPDEAYAADPPEPAPLTEGPLWTAIILLAAIVIAVEWATYHRRVTV